MSAPRERFRAFVESLLGAPYDGSLEEIARLVGVDPDDPSSWADLEHRWESVRPEVEQLRGQDGPAVAQVESVFQSVVERDAKVFDPSVLQTYLPGIRMLISTRVIEGEIDNGGWPAVFFNHVEDHLPAAIEGYQLLRLRDHAALAERVRSHGWVEPVDDTPDDPAWEAFDKAWFGLPDAEEARARYIRDHAGDFPT